MAETTVVISDTRARPVDDTPDIDGRAYEDTTNMGPPADGTLPNEPLTGTTEGNEQVLVLEEKPATQEPGFFDKTGFLIPLAAGALTGYLSKNIFAGIAAFFLTPLIYEVFTSGTEN